MNVRSGSTNIDDNNFNLSQFTTMAESIFEEYSNQLKPTIFFIILQNSTKQNSQIKTIISSLMSDETLQSNNIINHIAFDFESFV